MPFDAIRKLGEFEARPYKSVAPQEVGADPNSMGPTGRVFLRPDGARSTHLNTVTDIPSGGFSYYPLLVPGQSDISALLSGARPSRDQISVALTDAMKRGGRQSFQSVDDALAAEREWHQTMENR